MAQLGAGTGKLPLHVSSILVGREVRKTKAITCYLSRNDHRVVGCLPVIFGWHRWRENGTGLRVHLHFHPLLLSWTRRG